MAEAPQPALGARIRRFEDHELLQGRATFVDDLALPDTVHLRFLRSPEPHARLLSVDVTAARELPGVLAAVTEGDLGLGPLLPPIENDAAIPTPRPLLAADRVRFVGEAIAAVAATDPYLAEDGCEAIAFDLDPLPVVATTVRALEPDAPRLAAAETNVLFESSIEAGDPDAAFARAAVTVDATFVNPRYSAVPMEPRGIVARPTPGGGLEVWSSSQAPHSLARLLAEILGLAPGAVRVRCPHVGGGFGQKAHAYPEDVVAAWLALQLGRPVKWTEDRNENLLAASHARDQIVRVRAAAGADGRLLAIDADVTCDTGAYGVYPHGHVLEALGTPLMIPGPYVLEHYRARSRSVATNKCPEGAYRGVGLPVSAFVHERLMDLLASELGLDRAEIRRRNLVPADRMPHTTVTHQRYDSGDYVRALDAALDAIDYDDFAAEQERARRAGRLIGLGIASYVEYTGINSRVFQGRGMRGIAGFDAAQVTLGRDGRVRVWTTLPDIGQGVTTTFAQIVADALAVEPGRVDVMRADTGAAPIHGTGAFASRSAIAGGGALREATAELVRRIKEDAGERLEIDPADLVVTGGRVHAAGAPAQGLTFAELAAADAERYRVASQYDPEAIAYPYATHACRVEIDPETGGLRIDRYVVVEDCGRVLNPIVVEGQAHGAVAQGIGGALLESMVYDADGQPTTGSLMDYLVPTAADVPSLQITHLEIPAPETPNGAKGVGEGGTLAPPGALAGAVADALGVQLTELPLTPERIRAAVVASGLTVVPRML